MLLAPRPCGAGVSGNVQRGKGGTAVWRKLLIVWVLGMSFCTAPQAGVLPKDSAEQYELLFWESIKDSNHASDYEAYLEAYPKGRFSGLARSRSGASRCRRARPLPSSSSGGTVRPRARPVRRPHSRVSRPTAR